MCGLYQAFYNNLYIQNTVCVFDRCDLAYIYLHLNKMTRIVYFNARGQDELLIHLYTRIKYNYNLYYTGALKKTVCAFGIAPPPNRN